MNKWNKIKKRNLKSLGEAPIEASQNLRAPELAPRDNRFTGRTKRIAFTCRPEFAEELRKMAFEQNCYQIEILEKALEAYKANLKNKSVSTELKKQQQKPTPKPLNRFIKVDFNCDKCHQKFERDTVYSPASNLDQLSQYPTYCTDCGENKPEFCSFRTETNQASCPHFVFDKKKQLCRSHNKQVWKKFHEFLSDKSVSTTAAWYEAWNQSNDWKYFWNLAKEKEDE